MKQLIGLMLVAIICLSIWNIQLQKKMDFLNKASSFSVMTSNGTDVDMVVLWGKIDREGNMGKFINWGNGRFKGTKEYKKAFLTETGNFNHKVTKYSFTKIP